MTPEVKLSSPEDHDNVPAKAVVKLLSGSEPNYGIDDYGSIEGGTSSYYGNDDGVLLTVVAEKEQ